MSQTAHETSQPALTLDTFAYAEALPLIGFSATNRTASHRRQFADYAVALSHDHGFYQRESARSIYAAYFYAASLLWRDLGASSPLSEDAIEAAATFATMQIEEKLGITTPPADWSGTHVYWLTEPNPTGIGIIATRTGH